MHIHETVNEGDSLNPCSKPGCGAPCLQYTVMAPGPTSQALTRPCQTLLTTSPLLPKHPPVLSYLQTFPQLMPLCFLGMPLPQHQSCRQYTCMHLHTHSLTCAHMNSGGGGMAASDQCSPWLPGGGGPSVTLPSGVKQGA